MASDAPAARPLLGVGSPVAQGVTPVPTLVHVRTGSRRRTRISTGAILDTLLLIRSPTSTSVASTGL